MDKLSKAQETILETLDEEIVKLEDKLAKVQPYIDELNRLRRTRAVLLSERVTMGGRSNGAARITMEQVVQAARKVEEPFSPGEIAEVIGVTDAAVRSHLNRYKDEKYRKTGDGWELIGEEEDE